jgi:hypothetical protein
VRRLPSAARPGDTEPDPEHAEGGEVGSTMRAVAPPIQSFASGRRR